MAGRVTPQSRGKKAIARKVRIEELECLPGINERISRGWPLKKVAEWMKSEGVPFSVETMVTALEAYRKSLPAAQLAEHALPSLHQAAVEQVAQGLDVLGELERLYFIQRDRVDIDYTIEKNLKKLFKTTHREIQEARELLVSYAQVQMDHGLTKRHLGVVEVETTNVVVNDPSMVNVLESPKSRQRVLSVFDRISALSERLDDEDEDEVPVATDPAEAEPQAEQTL